VPQTPLGKAQLRRQLLAAEVDESKLAGFLPEHLALNPHQPLMDKRFKRGFDPLRRLKKGEHMLAGDGNDIPNLVIQARNDSP
jgi:hypothetical protein